MLAEKICLQSQQKAKQAGAQVFFKDMLMCSCLQRKYLSRVQGRRTVLHFSDQAGFGTRHAMKAEGPRTQQRPPERFYAT